jgi:hypothetical protein
VTAPTRAAPHPVDQAAALVREAAAACEQRTGGDVFSTWAMLADLLRLTAAAMAPPTDPPHTGAPNTQPRPDPVALLDQATASLNGIPPGEAPPELPVWVQHLAEMRSRVAAAGRGQ